jgi:hypothetical protein
MNEHILIVALVIQYGEEDVLLAEKTWPLPIPEKTRLIAILTNKFFMGGIPLEIAVDVTESSRYERYLGQLWNGTWTSIRMFYLPEDKLELCRQKRPA